MNIKSLVTIDKRELTSEHFQSSSPFLVKGLVSQWPIVKLAKQSNDAFLQYFSERFAGGKARFIELDGQGDGYFFYNNDFSGFNFSRKIAPLSTVFSLLKQRATDDSALRIAIQSAPIEDYFPGFGEENPFDWMPKSVQPRIWLGNDSKVNSHFDDADNVACVIAGRRRVVLFPPEQIVNLKVGPLENTPGGAPISMIKLMSEEAKSDAGIQAALAQAFVAELEPGDAIYIPTLWWHHIEALDDINCLVNYWRGGSIAGLDHPSGLDATLMGLISLAKLPKAQRQAWQAVFNHLVFNERTEFDYIPAAIRGALGGSQQGQENIIRWLQNVLKNQQKPE